MNNTDIIELLQRLHDYMDNRADSDWEGTGNNVELAFVGEIDEAIKSLTTIRRDLGDINGQIHNWKLDVCAGLKPLLHSLQRGEQTVSGAIAKLEGRHV